MSTYIPLYRKYRPQAFGDLIGQESVVKTLSNAVTTGRISHAYLFTGPRGTGKTSSARILAKSLNCESGPTVTPCGKCPACIDITASSSVDVIEIDAASNRKVEDARNLLEKVHFVPVSGKYKIYIIDEVHMLTAEAFNTLLKTLEEPPKNLVFILATTESHKVLNTIISRCQRFDFKRVTQALIINRLREIAEKESIQINDKALLLIAKKAYGGMRDALSLLDQASVLSSQGDEITEPDILMLFGSLSEETLHELAQNIAERNTINLVHTAQKAVESCEPVNVIRELVNYFRNMLIIKTANDIERIKPVIDLSESIIDGVKAQSERFETDELVQIIEKLSEYEKNIKTTHQQQLWLEISLLSICHRQDMYIIRDLEQRIEALEGGIIPVKIPEIKQSKPEPVPVPTESLKQAKVDDFEAGNPDELWDKMLTSFRDDPTRAFFKIFKPVEISPAKIVITCANEKWIEKARIEKIKPLEEAARAVFNDLPGIIIRTPLPDDKIPEQKPPEPGPATPQIEPPKPKPTSQIAIDTEGREVIEDEVKKELEDLNRPIAPINVSDQCKMVLDVFNGKVIEQ